MNIVPSNPEFERALLVSVLVDPLLLPKVSMMLEASDFFKATHQEIWSVIISLGENADSLAVQTRLKPETAIYFKELVEDSDKILPAISNAMFYAETVKQKSKLRAGIALGQEIIAICYQEPDGDEAIQSLEEMFANFLQRRVLEEQSDTSIDAFKKFLSNLHTKEIDDPNVIKTGFTDLDLMTQRMEGLIVLAARPGMGKTALAINIAAEVAKKEHGVVFFSLEQDRNQIFERMLSSESDVPLEEIRLGVYRNDEVSLGKIEKTQKMMEHLMPYIHIDDRANVPTSYMSSVARQKKYEWGNLGLIIVDYLHIVRLNGKQTVDALGDATKELRALGKELGCPVLLLSQLRREDRDSKKKRPELSDLRSSGEIEQSADMVWFIYRESYYDQPGLVPTDDVAEIVVSKSRNGRQGIIQLEWKPEIVRFQNVVRRR